MRFSIFQKMIKKSRGNRKELMEKVKKLIEQKLNNEGLSINVIAREKHVYGLYPFTTKSLCTPQITLQNHFESQLSIQK